MGNRVSSPPPNAAQQAAAAVLPSSTSLHEPGDVKPSPAAAPRAVVLPTPILRSFLGFQVKQPAPVRRSRPDKILILAQTLPVCLRGGLPQTLALGFDKGHVNQTPLPVSRRLAASQVSRALPAS